MIDRHCLKYWHMFMQVRTGMRVNMCISLQKDCMHMHFAIMAVEHDDTSTLASFD